ncbi:MAG: class I SAM-dependent methyltransferase [Planctomycetes bacterium]|nr:class I SAM-dependent methyltransferase [Planctomycetota bacterium]
MSLGLDLAERGLLPDAVTRLGIRRLLRDRLRSESHGGPEGDQQHLMGLVEELKRSPLAVHTDAANAQHYEVPAEFYLQVLGKRLKYSSCYYPDGVTGLDQAEEVMLGMTCERAQLADGMDILEIGCGWGSLTLWMAEKYPHARITAVSNSASQREFITARARERGFANVTVITANMIGFDTQLRFDRVVSVECFEHLRNYHELFRRISTWLKPDGKLFTHVFSHSRFAYPFETSGTDDWMGKHFFTGGIMPSDQLFLYFQEHLAIAAHWRVDGTHYARTARGWLDNLDRRRDTVMGFFRRDADHKLATVRCERWRMFFMACEELFGYAKGQEWIVSHYLFTRR